MKQETDAEEGCLPKPTGAPGIEARIWVIENKVATGTSSKLALRA